MNLLLPDNSVATIGGNVQVDDYFAPKRQIINDTCFELSTYNSILRSNGTITSSVASSLSYSFYRNTWELRIPTPLSINKSVSIPVVKLLPLYFAYFKNSSISSNEFITKSG